MRVTAEQLATQQREISVAEFFTKNRHLLGFDNPRKALLTTVKEAVDNSLDACEEAGILPSIRVKIEVVAGRDGATLPPAQADRFIITVTDNGPGIVKEQVPRIFAKLLYGSKFHRLRQSRGQQGIGISAAGMYGQLTTGKPVRVISRTSPGRAAHSFAIQINTQKNEPVVLEDNKIEDWEHPQGTQVSIELEGRYQRGRASVEEYLELTAVANPHIELFYETPEGNLIHHKRGVEVLPRPPKEIKPHPYGIEFGMFLKMLQDTKAKLLGVFLSSDFSRVSANAAGEICKEAKLSANARPRDVVGAAAEKLFSCLQNAKLMAPPTDCLSPIGEEAILAGLYKQIRGEFYTAVTRSPQVYRGNPFIIEVGLAFGNDPKLKKEEPEEPAAPLAEGESADGEDDVQLARLMRYANRVPLLYQQSACCTFQSVVETAWKLYGMSQSRGAMPQGPLVVFVHMASSWVPFTSESKEAIADYDAIRKEIKLGIQEAGRRLGKYIRKREHAKDEWKRRNIFALYIGEVAEACGRLKKGSISVDRLKKQLLQMAEERTGGEETDRILRKQREEEERREHTIVVTPSGAEGAIPKLLATEAPPADGAAPAMTTEPGAPDAAPAVQASLFPDVAPESKAKRKNKKAARAPGAVESRTSRLTKSQPTLFGKDAEQIKKEKPKSNKKPGRGK
ncbi:MAG: DNA topoisomerase VI subunit B [Planctomycetes bacterium]|nr:DNA topoisomerase VI subunit B [Planctomycetota bacterium]